MSKYEGRKIPHPSGKAYHPTKYAALSRPRIPPYEPLTPGLRRKMHDDHEAIGFWHHDQDNED